MQLNATQLNSTQFNKTQLKTIEIILFVILNSIPHFFFL